MYLYIICPGAHANIKLSKRVSKQLLVHLQRYGAELACFQLVFRLI